jgi:hypothetical protein
MELEYESDVFVADAGQFLMRLSRDQFVVQIQLAGIIGIHRRQNVEQSGLPRSRFSHDRGEFPFLDSKGNIL